MAFKRIYLMERAVESLIMLSAILANRTSPSGDDFCIISPTTFKAHPTEPLYNLNDTNRKRIHERRGETDLFHYTDDQGPIYDDQTDFVFVGTSVSIKSLWCDIDLSDFHSRMVILRKSMNLSKGLHVDSLNSKARLDNIHLLTFARQTNSPHDMAIYSIRDGLEIDDDTTRIHQVHEFGKIDSLSEEIQSKYPTYISRVYLLNQKWSPTLKDICKRQWHLGAGKLEGSTPSEESFKERTGAEIRYRRSIDTVEAISNTLLSTNPSVIENLSEQYNNSSHTQGSLGIHQWLDTVRLALWMIERP